MSAKNQVTPKNPLTPSDAKGSLKSFGLASPEPTPAVEDGRIEADRQRIAAAVHQLLEAPPASPGETKDNKVGGAPSDANAHLGEVALEIERILGCSDTSYAEILGVKPDSTDNEKIAAWRHLGCLLHAKSTDHKDAAVAFEKLRIAAENQSVSHLDIDEVVSWNGEEKLPDLDEDTPMAEDAIPVPPAYVTDIYDKATPTLYRLGQDPTDPIALKLLQELNAKISKSNAAEKESLGTNGAEVSLDRWCIPLSFFGPHYNQVLENYNVLAKDRTNQPARNAIAKEKKLIDSLIERNHFPQAWTVETADEYLQNTDKATATAEDIKPAADEATITYPWTTAKAADGSLIIGVRKWGGFGTQVCIEMQEKDGRIIRRLESASKVGLQKVQKYWETDGFKNLAEGQSQWSYRDRNDFEELLWVTKSQTKRKNIAANNKDPNADCCVKFHDKGIQILTVTSFNKVLGPSSARAEIEKVCWRDNISPPWKAGNVSQYYDRSKVEKDPVRRRALEDAQATSSIDDRLAQRKLNLDEAAGQESRVAEQLEDRVKSLEKEMKDMRNMATTLNRNMEMLMGMFKEFMGSKKD
ncbi:DnaJ domain-containing protein [Colletotrichum tofieldiae]|uniref:DnaJ domain-containing protein n=1 Tax=Colletotrichum tofieldiae TaxID=708197 RepID=A0A166MTD8_9PEZI|nr:DnaJ domain-containing protein [Colletotrichum tofieldiae]